MGVGNISYNSRLLLEMIGISNSKTIFFRITKVLIAVSSDAFTICANKNFVFDLFLLLAPESIRKLIYVSRSVIVSLMGSIASIVFPSSLKLTRMPLTLGGSRLRNSSSKISSRGPAYFG